MVWILIIFLVMLFIHVFVIHPPLFIGFIIVISLALILDDFYNRWWNS